ncbi:MAG: antibiotic biosynthesis monooxygenase [Bacillales bacterium]|jgi:hypothetical protein|nr:antibiotic biosynthesis monooxygenase [Bacillales bacterium]
MKFYITNGTVDFMKRYYYKNKDKHHLFFLLEGGKQDITLFQETNQKTVFGNPRKYEVVNGIGDFIQNGVVLMKHITVEKEDCEYFEIRFEGYFDIAKYLPGLIAIRLLRPIKGTDYIILTAWKNAMFSESWEISKEYLLPSSHILHGDFLKIPTYTKKYWAPSEEEIFEQFHNL